MEKVPLEDDEAIAFADWLRLKHIPHAHIANESRSGSRNAMIRGAKLKRMGQARGYYDYDVFVPVTGATGEVDCYELIKIELKRKRGGRVSPEQKEWGKIYEAAGIPARVCKGADEAIAFVEETLHKINGRDIMDTYPL